jgi:cellulose synthase/poly-beta-1,6-N-acetylglucosamine synthase-like glycosyltransferase
MTSSTLETMSPSEATTAATLDRSINRLRTESPEMSADHTLTGPQRRGALIIAGFVLLALLIAPVITLTALMGLATMVYVLTLGFRMRLVWLAARRPTTLIVSEEEARSLVAHELPVYTVLVPAYHEAEILPQLLAALDAIEYPADRLDVKLLIEEDDEATMAAAVAARPGPHVEIVTVPVAAPRTKPKACNYGLSRARGDIVTIYDAEDHPSPLQLRQVVAAFAQVGPETVCLQAKLSYHNAEQNLITKWFTIEYATWFEYFLPGLVAMGMPVPLGGTSNHIRRAALEEVGAWDPFNVTEDADLGIRLHRRGYRSGVLESTTYEEANSDFVNWVKQRSRWYKGYLQTWLVHLRRPRQLWRELGPAGFLGFHLFVGGTPILALLNPFFWTLTLLWFVVKPDLVQDLFPGPVLYPALACWALGNVGLAYMNVLTVRFVRLPALIGAALLSPLYWVMMSAAALKATIQLAFNPQFWEKTTHGLDAPGTKLGS